MLDLAAIRQDIPALGRCVYLNTGGVAPNPRPVYEVLTREFTDQYLNGSPLILRPQSLQMETQRARAFMARFLGVTPEEICFTRGVSDGASLVLNGFPWQPGDQVIITNEEHSAFLLPTLLLKRRFGVDVRILELENDSAVILQRFRDLLNPRTRLVALSHVTTDNGIRLPVQAMCTAAREAGVPVLLDGAQSVGQFAVDCREIGCAFYSVLSYKWLLGPYSAGALYIARDWVDRLAVTQTGARPERKVDYAACTFELCDDALKFEAGAHSWPLYFAMAEAARYLQTIGLAEIEHQVQEQSAYLRRGMAAIPGVRVVSPLGNDIVTGITTFQIEGQHGSEISMALRNRWNIITRPTHLRYDGVRVSVAFFTSREELDALLEAVTALAAGH
jgi:selenocysteine lyase/cysteine desulfurase